MTLWSPNINIFRDPRWGRGQETYGEDPCLTAKTGVAFIKGIQGEGKYRKTDATIKHFAVHNGPENQRHSFNAFVSEKDLRETYLYAFKYCIDNTHPSAVMGAYNRVNGEPCCGSKTLLKKILFDEWKFDGYVVSDCGAINDFHSAHYVTDAPQESCALAVNSGCYLNCGSAFSYLRQAVDEGLISEATITQAVTKLFETRFRLGEFADDCEYDDIPYDIIECEAHRALNRKAAQKSIVLLKNDGILPLSPDKTVAVIGPNADSVDVLLGNYNGTIGSDKPNLELPAVQRELIRKIAKLDKPVIFVNVSGSCINLEFENAHFSAVLQCFYPGAEGGNALADIIYGKVSPSARLPISLYRSADELPPFDDYSMEIAPINFSRANAFTTSVTVSATQGSPKIALTTIRLSSQTTVPTTSITPC